MPRRKPTPQPTPQPEVQCRCARNFRCVHRIMAPVVVIINNPPSEESSDADTDD